MYKYLFNTTPGSILIGSILISFSILLGSGVLQIKGIKTGASTAAQQIQQPPQQQAAAPDDTGPVKVSVDDDPVLGAKNAPLTMVEFSDYECPFCKRYFEQTYTQLKKDYIDTGKLKVVFRDLPLSFHDPMATTEAIAANCAREQGGDDAYYSYHDLMFKNTTSNGNGLTKDQLNKFAGDLGLNSANFKSCLDSEKYKDEVSKDLADAGSVGASGTPTFFIGKSSPSGTIEGTKIVGAQPYSIFQSTIDSLLK